MAKILLLTKCIVLFSINAAESSLLTTVNEERTITNTSPTPSVYETSYTSEDESSLTKPLTKLDRTAQHQHWQLQKILKEVAVLEAENTRLKTQHKSQSDEHESTLKIHEDAAIHYISHILSRDPNSRRNFAQLHKIFHFSAQQQRKIKKLIDHHTQKSDQPLSSQPSSHTQPYIDDSAFEETPPQASAALLETQSKEIETKKARLQTELAQLVMQNTESKTDLETSLEIFKHNCMYYIAWEFSKFTKPRTKQFANVLKILDFSKKEGRHINEIIRSFQSQSKISKADGAAITEDEPPTILHHQESKKTQYKKKSIDPIDTEARSPTKKKRRPKRQSDPISPPIAIDITHSRKFDCSIDQAQQAIKQGLQFHLELEEN